VLIDRSWRGNTGAVKALLKVGADLHAGCDWALRLASAEGHTETVRVLLDAGADVHAQNDDALRLARAGGHTETVKLLEAAAASPFRPVAGAKPPAPAP
jgi:ankyrin repeat protein